MLQIFRSCPRTPKSGKKVFGSIERGLDKMKNMLTPRGKCGVPGDYKGPSVAKVSDIEKFCLLIQESNQGMIFSDTSINYSF